MVDMIRDGRFGGYDDFVWNKFASVCIWLGWIGWITNDLLDKPWEMQRMEFYGRMDLGRWSRRYNLQIASHRFMNWLPSFSWNQRMYEMAAMSCGL